MGTTKTNTLDEIEENLINFFQKREEVQLVHLFGSCLRGKFEKNRDIDIALLLESMRHEGIV
jgi:predicted nucleotidyltransferase